MANVFSVFENLVRASSKWMYVEEQVPTAQHPFDVRNIHPTLPPDVRRLFDNSHYSQATFEAYKYVDKEVARLASSHASGFNLMMAVLSETNPIVKLTPCLDTTERDEQKGYQFLFAGSMMAIRNPRGHQYSVADSVDDCLDHLGLASTLLRRLEAANFVLKV